MCSGPDGPAVLQDHALGLLYIAAALQDYLADRRGNLDLHAPALGRLGHGLGDRTHAAPGVAPGADAAVYLAEGVMEQHEGGARMVGAHHVADDTLEAEDALDRLALEPAVQIVADAHGHDLRQGRLAPAVHLAQAVAELHGAPEILEPAA
jgi:hypothetical protein